MNVLVKQLAPNEIKKLKAEFEKIDDDMSGFIEVAELEKALKDCNLDMSAAEIHKIIGELDYAEN